MRRRPALPALAAVLGMAATTLLVTAPAASANGLPALTVSTTTVTVGERFTVSGAGCVDPDNPGSPTSVSFAGGGVAGPAIVDANGAWSLTFVWSDSTPAYYGLGAMCDLSDGTRLQYPSVTVVVPGSSTTTPPQWWQTCGPLPGNPGVTGCPGPPNHSLPPRGQPTRSTAPRTTSVPSAAVRSTTAPLPTTSVAPTSTVAAELAPTPAAGCRDCGRLTGGDPVAPGARLALSYAGFQPGEQVTAVLHSTPVELGTFTADASGVLTTSVTVPASLEAGVHTLTLTGAVTGDRVVHFRLTAPAPQASVRPVSTAGWGPVGWSVVGAAGVGAAGVLVLAGGGLVRRRRRSAVPQDRPAPGIG